MTIHRLVLVQRVLDALLWLYAGILLVVFVSGGFSVMFFGATLSIYNPQNPALTFGILLLLRQWLSRADFWENLPVIRQSFLLIRYVQKRYPLPATVWAGILIGGYAVLMSVVTVLKHASYQSHAFDLGIFDQALWNTVFGKPLDSTILNRHFFGEHFSPILIVVAQVYRLYAHPAAILIVQTCALASGGLPIYWLAKRKLDSPALAALWVWVYVSYQPLRNVNLFDFHEIAFATPLLLFAFWFLDQRRYGWFGIFLLAALSCKEEISTIVFIFGVYIALVHKKRLAGALLALSGVMIFFVDIWVIIPHYRNAPFAFVERYSYLGDSIPAILRTLLLRPLYVAQHVLTAKKFHYLLDVFGPVGFLSFLSPSHLLLTTPTLLQNLLSSSKPQYTIGYQYTAPLTPFVFIAAIHGMRNLLNRPDWRMRLRLPPERARVQAVIVAVLFWYTLAFFGHPCSYDLLKYRLTPHTRLTDAVLQTIPPTASVSAQETLLPHLSQRAVIYEFPNLREAEYIVLDTAASTVPLSREEYRQQVEALLRGDAYGVVQHQETLVLLQRGSSRTQNTETLEQLWK